MKIEKILNQIYEALILCALLILFTGVVYMSYQFKPYSFPAIAYTFSWSAIFFHYITLKVGRNKIMENLK